MTTMYSYRISRPFSFVTVSHRNARYAVLRDEHPFDAAAMHAGMVKESFEKLVKTVTSIARLSSVIAPSEEVKARELLETMIDAKRSYVQAEQKRQSYEL
jgi:hypothetical protein